MNEMSEWSYTFQDLELDRQVSNVVGTGEEGRRIATQIVDSLNSIDKYFVPNDQYQARVVWRTWDNYSGTMTEWEEVDG